MKKYLVILDVFRHHKNTLLFLVFVLVVIFLSVFVFFKTTNLPSENVPESNVPVVVEDKDELVVKPAKILFLGDMMLGRNVNVLMEKNGDDYPFSNMNAIVGDVDLVVANLEGPVMEKYRLTPSGSTTFSFKPSVLEAIKLAGINLLNLANNHTYDYGADAFAETISLIDLTGLNSFGHPREAGSERVFYFNKDNTKVAIVGFNDVYNSLDEETALQTIADVAKDEELFVIVSLHWGDEYKLVHNVRQERIAHALIDEGADAIISHHPHVVQDIEEYNGELIFYSLGNFIFDQYFSEDTQESLGILLELKNDKVDYKLLPISLPKSQPMLMEKEEEIKFLEALAERSTSFLQDDIKRGSLRVER